MTPAWLRWMVLATVVGIALPAAQARVLERVPSYYVKVQLAQPAAKHEIAIDGPVLLLCGGWSKSGGRAARPQLLVPVRLVVPDALKLVDLEPGKSVPGVKPVETYRPEGRVFRLLLPVPSTQSSHSYEVGLPGNASVRVKVVLSFEPPEAITYRSPRCGELGVSLEATLQEFRAGGTEPSLVYLHCGSTDDSTLIALYGMEGTQWEQYGFGAHKIAGGQGLFIRLPRPKTGVLMPGQKAEFVAKEASGKRIHYGLSYLPPYQPHRFWADAFAGLGYSNFNQTYLTQGISEGALYAKLAIGARLWPEGLDANADFSALFGTLLQGGLANAPSYRNLQLNARLGYVQPSSPAESEWSLMGGLYGWFLMISPGYSLNDSLLGPELFAQYKHRRLNARSWWINAQYALLAANAQNYLLKLGYGIEAWGAGGPHPVSLNLELSRIGCSQINASQTSSNLLFSVGYSLF